MPKMFSIYIFYFGKIQQNVRLPLSFCRITREEYDKKHQELADELQRLEIELSEH